MGGTKGALITAENAGLQLDLIILEIKVTELALRNGILEDAPSLVINLASLITTFESGTFSPTIQFYLSLSAVLLSCATGGRKTYLGSKVRELKEKKRVVEEQLEAAGGDVRLTVLKGSVVVGLRGGKVVPVGGGEKEDEGRAGSGDV